MVMNFARAFLFGSQEHKGIDVKNPYFLKAISHIIVSLNEAACNSSTGQLVNLSTAMCKCELFSGQNGNSIYSYIYHLQQEDVFFLHAF